MVWYQGFKAGGQWAARTLIICERDEDGGFRCGNELYLILCLLVLCFIVWLIFRLFFL